MPLRTRVVRPMRPFQPGILVVSGKHGDLHYHVPTEAHLHAAALKVLQYHNGDLRYYEHLKHDKKEERKYGPKHPGMEPEGIEKLPPGEIRNVARKAWKEWSEHQVQLEESHKEWLIIQDTLKNQDGDMAWRILQQRRDNEYERVSVERDDGVETKLLPRPKTPCHGQRWTDPKGQRWIFDGEKGRNLGWIKGDHAPWKAIYAAHENGVLEPEIEQYDNHEVVDEVRSKLYSAHKEGQTSGLVGTEMRAHPEDFKAAIEDMVDFADHPNQSMRLVTDPEEALKKGEAVFEHRDGRYGRLSCRVLADDSVESIADREAKYEKRRQERKRNTG